MVRANKIVAQGRVIETEGKTTNVQLMEKEDDGIDHLEEAMDDIEIEIHGREDLTRAEAQRNRFIARLLQGQSALDTCDFIRKIWLPSNEDIAELNSVGAFVKETPVDPESDPLRGTQLNQSQAEVARAMLSEQHSIALVHGPYVPSVVWGTLTHSFPFAGLGRGKRELYRKLSRSGAPQESVRI